MDEKITLEAIKKDVKKLVSEIVEMDENELKDDAKLTEDLGVDSMMALEILASIEKKYKVRIPEQELPNMNSLQNIYALLEKRLLST